MFIENLKAHFYRQTFLPKWYSVFLNPNYFMRRAIADSVIEFSPLLKGRLLDFGCGTKPYRHLFSNKEYIGVDLQYNEGHHNSTSKVDFFYDGNLLPFEDSYFDCVYSSEVFEHVFNLENILREINRVLQPGGSILITIPFCWPEHEQPNDFARYTSFGIKSLFERNGFEIIQQKKKGNYLQCLTQLTTYGIFNIIPGSGVIKTILSLPVTACLNIFTIMLNPMAEHRQTLFLNQAILARKR